MPPFSFRSQLDLLSAKCFSSINLGSCVEIGRRGSKSLAQVILIIGDKNEIEKEIITREIRAQRVEAMTVVGVNLFNPGCFLRPSTFPY